jgi:hypothetical protein
MSSQHADAIAVLTAFRELMILTARPDDLGRREQMILSG